MGKRGNCLNSCIPLQIIATRAKTIRGLAAALEQGDIHVGFCSRPKKEIQKLLLIPGIGNWTAQYITMRTMEWPDAFLETDIGSKESTCTPYAKRDAWNGKGMATMA